jgi:apolipoprotein N-acyltransferase
MSSATTKRLGAAIVLVLAPLLHVAIPGPTWIRTSAAVAGGLMMIFFSRERIDDERVQDLKLKALSAAFSVSFTLTLIVNWFLNRDFHPGRDFDGAAGVLRSISAFDLIVLTMVVALALFHYWRFQDAAPPAKAGDVSA